MKNTFEGPALTPESEFAPLNKKEKELWEIIDSADEPIRMTLKRINRIAVTSFSDTGLQTIESCSGHTDEDGLLIENTQPIIFFMVDKSESLEKVIPTFRALFNQAVHSTNEKLGAEVVKYGPLKIGHNYTSEGEYLSSVTLISNGRTKSYPSFACEVTILGEKNVDTILKTFWDEMDIALSHSDGLYLPSERTEESFHRRSDRSYEME